MERDNQTAVVPSLDEQIAAVLEEAAVSEAYDKHHAKALRAAANTLQALNTIPSESEKKDVYQW